MAELVLVFKFRGEKERTRTLYEKWREEILEAIGIDKGKEYIKLTIEDSD